MAWGLPPHNPYSEPMPSSLLCKTLSRAVAPSMVGVEPSPGVLWGCLVTALGPSSAPSQPHPHARAGSTGRGRWALGWCPGSPRSPCSGFVLESQARKEASREEPHGEEGTRRMGFHCVTVGLVRWWLQNNSSPRGIHDFPLD